MAYGLDLNSCLLFSNGDGTFGGRFPGDQTEEWTAQIKSGAGEPLEIHVECKHVVMDKVLGTLVFKQDIAPNPLLPQPGPGKLYTADGRFYLTANPRNTKAPLLIKRVHPQSADEGLAALFGG